MIRNFYLTLFAPFGKQFSEEEFKRSLLESEKNRATILLILFLLSGTGYILLVFIFNPEYILIFRKSNAAIWITIIICILIIYEALLRLFFKRLIERRLTPPVMMRYANAFWETTIPAFFIIIVSGTVNPFYVLNSPAPFAFFIFIILSTLRLDFYLCFFTGSVAALEFTALNIYYINTAADPTSIYLSSSLNIAVKSLFLFLSGFAAGFVTSQIKNRIITSIKTLEERNRVKDLFGQQVSQEVADELLKIKTEFAAQKRKVCVMFLDIRDFSLMVKDKEPEEIVKFQNLMFSFMAEIISQNNGIINQFLGDGFMATFGAPLSFKNDCQNAVNASIDILNEINKRNSRGLIPGVRIGIGIHTDQAVTGNVGSSERKQYSVTGSVVIIAARIEQLNKVYNTTMLISKEVFDELDDNKNCFELLGDVSVKGQEEPVILYRFI